MTHSTIYIGSNSHIARLDLTDDANAAVNDATVTMESLVEESSGTAVSGVTVPLTLDYVLASSGRYEGGIPFAAALTAERWYIATFLAISGTLRGEWVERVRATTRRG